ncbi:hypothetical protein H1S01_00060 [Heliobacterium chlorum]|uniref:Uncharacterized protein n=1 Tax=Heliobacterium chlorum TaxID=2698 RepID=A0ABR7SWG2_HELCL|nr:hypothetical protein [Heliobacterium chlorum]MBC9782900.1 hypothetical protein [Heliobacterium chlorum]
MKKTVGIMVLSALLLQGGILFGLEYWTASAYNTADHVSTPAKSQWRKLHIDTSLNDAKQFSLSYQGEYLAWNSEDSFTVWDIHQERPIYQEKMPPGQKIDYIQWLTDRNRLLLVTEQSAAPVNLPSATPTKGKSANQVLADAMDTVDKRPLPKAPSVKQLEISFLNCDGTQRMISTRIRGLTMGEEVKEATVSSQSNLLYLTLGNDRMTTGLYRVDIQHDAMKVNQRQYTNIERLTVNPALGHIFAEFWNDTTNKPLVQGIKGMQLINPAQQPLNYLLVGVDRKNNLYLGEGIGHQVENIWIWNGKKLEKERQLPETVHRDRIVIGPDGQLAIIDEPASVLKVYPNGSDSPSTYSFEAGAKLIQSDKHYVGLLKTGTNGGDLWLLSF